MLAARGARDLDSGEESVPDADEAARLRRQARRVWLRAAVAAAALTGLTFLLPR